MCRCLVNLNSISIVSFECKELLIKHPSCLQVIVHSTKHHNTFPYYYKYYCGLCSNIHLVYELLVIQQNTTTPSLTIINTIVACAVGPSMNPLQIKETQHVNILLQCMYRFFEQPNMKGNHA
jgi:hypothetical protein